MRQRCDVAGGRPARHHAGLPPAGWNVLLPSNSRECRPSNAGERQPQHGAHEHHRARSQTPRSWSRTVEVFRSSRARWDPGATRAPCCNHSAGRRTTATTCALDFPTGGIATGKMAAHVHRLIHVDGENLEAMSRANGLSVAFNGCLRQTYINTDIMLNPSRPGRGFLVVLQGTSEPESREWVLCPPTAHQCREGIAFAGTSNTSYRLMLHRLVDMRDDGTLARIKHIHVLGTGTLASAMCADNDPAMHSSKHQSRPSDHF